jgi:hypothetical protein
MELCTVTANRSLPDIRRLPNSAAFNTALFVITVDSDEITSAVSFAATLGRNRIFTASKNQPYCYHNSKQNNGENSYLVLWKNSPFAIFPAVFGGPSIQMAFPPFRGV